MMALSLALSMCRITTNFLFVSGISSLDRTSSSTNLLFFISPSSNPLQDIKSDPGEYMPGILFREIEFFGMSSS